MTGIIVRATQAQARLTCDARGCDQEWKSATYKPGRYGQEASQIAPALILGWRVFAGARGQWTYCPKHGPSAVMRLVHGEVSS